MGDFLIPKPENVRLIKAFNLANSSVYHVLGNHDMDGGFSKETAAQTFHGKKSQWIGPSPQELGYIILSESEQKEHLKPEISSLEIP